MRTKQGNKEQKILEAAISIFARRGFAKTKISDIAANAGVAVGSVYLYFPDKESILLRILENIWKELYRQLLPLYRQPDLPVRRKVSSFIRLALAALAGNPHIALLLSNEQNLLMMQGKGIFNTYYLKVKKIVSHLIRQGQQNGEITAEADADALAAFLIGGIRYLLYLWRSGNFALSSTEMETQLNSVIKDTLFNIRTL